MEKYSFFNSIAGDRKKFAEDFAEYFNSFIINGIFAAGQNLFVNANDDLTVTVTSGKAWINGYFYNNTDSFIMAIPLPDAVLSRIDRIVIRLDMTERKIGLKLLKGAISSSPTPPDIKRTGDYYDLCLADISVAKGAISVTQANITDNRLINTLCGLVRCPVDKVPTETLMLQFEQHLREQKILAETEINAMLDVLHNLIDGDTVGMLIEMIEGHKLDTAVHTTLAEKQATAHHIAKTELHTTLAEKQATAQAISKNTQDITAHTSNQTSHVTAADKATWNAKQNALPNIMQTTVGQSMTQPLVAGGTQIETAREVRNAVILPSGTTDFTAIPNNTLICVKK